jgi:hypothetical protein
MWKNISIPFGVGALALIAGTGVVLYNFLTKKTVSTKRINRDLVLKKLIRIR